MSQLVKIFKPDPSAVWVFKAMVIFAVLVTAAGLASARAMISCLGLFLLTVFAGLTFKQSGQTIEIYNDKIVFRHSGQEPWILPFENFSGIELVTTLRHSTKYSPGRTILLRFIDSDDKFCAEANVNVFDKSAIRTMIELIQEHKEQLSLNDQAVALLQARRYKGNTMDKITKTE